MFLASLVQHCSSSGARVRVSSHLSANVLTLDRLERTNPAVKGTLNGAVRATGTWVALFLLVLGSLGGQVRPPERRNVREPLALERLRKGVEAMGGDAAWRQIQSVQVSGQMVVNGGRADAFTWSDDWSKGLRTKRELTPSSTTMASDVRTSGSPVSARGSAAPAHAPFRPKFDVFNSVLAYAPAAAIEVALQDVRYSVSLLSQSQNGCVEVTLSIKRLEDGGVHTVICFSSETNLPAEARVALAKGAGNGAVITETIKYDAFEVRRGMLYPRKVMITVPGLKREYTFSDNGAQPTELSKGKEQ